MTDMNKTRSFAAWAAASLLALPLAGCYQKVVRADGWGSNDYDVQEPDAPTDAEQERAKQREKAKREKEVVIPPSRPPGS